MHDSEQSAQHAFERASLHLPSDSDIERLSFSGLASLLSCHREGTAEYRVVERAIKKHLAKDQAKINLKNVIIGGIMAGLFGLSGVVLGWWLRDSSTMQQPPSSSTEHQIQQGTFGKNTNSASIPVIKPISGQPIAVPEEVESNAQQSQ
ncbi:hypothetical protein [Litchfieldella anticariensis]|uniref:hypothetical protein n=1 Tax=Litchfieldella anticariensis TaxID=258591 RepID=UPI0011833749|nr:hypothetical protein [Halomonas anticariensis]